MTGFEPGSSGEGSVQSFIHCPKLLHNLRVYLIKSFGNAALLLLITETFEYTFVGQHQPPYHLIRPKLLDCRQQCSNSR